MAAALHAKPLGEPPRGLALLDAPYGSGEADYVAAALASCEVAPNASTRAMQSNAQAAARLAGQAANLKLRSTRSPARQQLRQQLGQARQRGSIYRCEVDAPAGRR
jgi:hypothetical protein